MAIELDVRDIHASYGAVKALQGVSIRVRDGETIAILGTNGNGKSTLLKCIAGLVSCTSGDIQLKLDGTSCSLHTMTPQDIVELGICMVPEGRKLFPRLTVQENLELGAYRKQARVHLRAGLDLCFEAFPVLKERRSQLAGSMSGGQQQMLALGRALMSSPRMLLIDEPSVGLAPIVVAQMIDKIGELKSRFGLTVLMAEQNFHQTVRIADRGYIIVHGEIAFSAANVQELQENDLVRSYYLGT